MRLESMRYEFRRIISFGIAFFDLQMKYRVSSDSFTEGNRTAASGFCGRTKILFRFNGLLRRNFVNLSHQTVPTVRFHYC
jgi:hypothetical protein